MGDGGGTSSRADDEENEASSGFHRIVWFRHMIHRWQSSSSSGASAATNTRSGDGERGNEPGASTDRNSDKDPLMAPAPDCSAEPEPPQRRPLLLPRVVEERREDGGGESDSPMTPVTPDAAAPADVPRGCCPVYVGAERRRFVVPTAYLGMPVFRRLLEKAEEEFEFHYVAGGVTIPCDTEAFKYILLVMERHRRGLVDDEGNAKDEGERGGSSSSSQAQPTTSSPADGGVTTAIANAEAIRHETEQ
ncbi:unnamed protein product [Urochloa decumbens]|uniref:Uncharacterized protein n=1 Tax=Urochloa decumbens TaxID=240449 RepID=A0ABC9DDH1_9POAL